MSWHPPIFTLARLSQATGPILLCLLLMPLLAPQQPVLADETPAPDHAGSFTAVQPQIAIIIDDIGYQLHNGRRAAAFPGALTLAVLPHSPNGSLLAQAAHAAGKEVMLHAPMSSVQNTPLDRGALTEDMDQSDFIATLSGDLDAVPHVRGVNNHMGSRLTREPVPMAWLMKVLKQRRLYFVDSRTSANSRAWEIAVAHHVPSVKRDIFLDHHRDPAQIEAQFERLIGTAKENGYAVAIGHPYTQTLDILEKRLQTLDEAGVELVPVSQILQRHELQLHSEVKLPPKRMVLLQ